jgi:hypothetical protein
MLQRTTCEWRHGLALGSLPVRFTFTEVKGPNSRFFPSTGHLELETDYIASEAKVAVMYSAFVLRDMARRFARVNGVTRSDDLFILLSDTKMKGAMMDSIRTLVPRVAKVTLLPPSTRPITDNHRLPKFRDVLSATPNGNGTLDVNFTKKFRAALISMTQGSNAGAATCVHGVSYGYLNCALAAGGFFNPQKDKGLWVAGDFLGERVEQPYVRIPSDNDGNVAQAGTTHQMAKLVSLIKSKRLLGAADCDEMLAVLSQGGSWIRDQRIVRDGCITQAKVGLGPLHGLSGPQVCSEILVLESPISQGRTYVVAWQNLLYSTRKGAINFRDIAIIIRDTISIYESFAASSLNCRKSY